ncbi:MAG: alpha-hydroxy-acid oxidizing enzyme [Propionibacteriales bacterium]|nr:alpha-hydroxy-acid oxidizing enzyme [Propionibacteriales bacterium]
MKVPRRRPRWSELRPLLRLEPPAVTPRARLARAHDVADLRRMARRRTPPAVFDYTEGAAGDEIASRRAEAAFARVEFVPHVLRDVSKIDTATTVLGRPSALPIAFGPTGFTRMMHHEGEAAVATAAERAGIPYALSTMGSTSIEAIADIAPGLDRWFQLYVWKDRAQSREFISRARESGYSTLVVTIDVTAQGNRLRDVRNGLTIPPSLTPRTLAGMARFPAWWFNKLTTEPLGFASMPRGDSRPLHEVIHSLFDPSVTFDDLDWLRAEWPGSLVVKGVLRPDDARELVRLGVDGLVVSSHGGRQLDRAVAPLDALPDVVEAVDGGAEVMLDGGVRNGADAVAAVALGARAVLVGRPYLYALMAGGEAGVDRLCDLLAADVRRTMALLGVDSVDQLSAESVRLRSR